MNARVERMVVFLHPVRGEKNETLIVLQVAQEHIDKRVAVDVLRCSLGQEQIGFINQNHSIPSFAPLEYSTKGVFCSSCIRAQYPSADCIERLFRQLGYTLCERVSLPPKEDRCNYVLTSSQCLAGAWRSLQRDNHSLTFASDNILELVLVSGMESGQCFYHVFRTGLHGELVEGIFSEVHFANAFNQKPSERSLGQRKPLCSRRREQGVIVCHFVAFVLVALGLVESDLAYVCVDTPEDIGPVFTRHKLVALHSNELIVQGARRLGVKLLINHNAVLVLQIMSFRAVETTIASDLPMKRQGQILP